MEVVDQADVVGSTGRIIRAVEESPPGTQWAIGTELHLVNRLKHEHPEQEIYFLSPMVCMCADDVSHRPAASVLGAGKPCRRHAGERDPSRRRDGPLGAGSLAADAGSEVSYRAGGSTSCKWSGAMSCQP